MSFVKSKSFKYFKNLLIGVGAAIVLIGALFKLESWEYASELLIFGLSMEAIIFLMLIPFVWLSRPKMPSGGAGGGAASADAAAGAH